MTSRRVHARCGSCSAGRARTWAALGFSRDDVESEFVPVYLERRLIDRSPFETIDGPGVGWLVRLAAWVGREAHPGLELGLCGVVVVTGGSPESPSGLVCGSFMSVSLTPPLVAVAPQKSSTSWPQIEAGGWFCANVLCAGQEQLARRFATSAAKGTDRFLGVPWTPAPVSGAPLLEGVSAWIDCRIRRRIDAGDHWLVLGEVLELNVVSESGVLVFHDGAFRPLI